MEMAVLSVVQHPNIVQLYACRTDAPDPRAPAGGGDGARAAAVNLLVLEFCELGSLRNAARGRGAWAAAAAPGAAPRPAAAAALAVRGWGAAGAREGALLDVAHALVHLHGMGLLHGDVKMDNVLLRGDGLRPHGFTCKARPGGARQHAERQGTLGRGGRGRCPADRAGPGGAAPCPSPTPLPSSPPAPPSRPERSSQTLAWRACWGGTASLPATAAAPAR
jgi:serine/threonine protein kinase